MRLFQNNLFGGAAYFESGEKQRAAPGWRAGSAVESRPLANRYSSRSLNHAAISPMLTSSEAILIANRIRSASSRPVLLNGRGEFSRLLLEIPHAEKLFRVGLRRLAKGGDSATLMRLH